MEFPNCSAEGIVSAVSSSLRLVVMLATTREIFMWREGDAHLSSVGKLPIDSTLKQTTLYSHPHRALALQTNSDCYIYDTKWGSMLRMHNEVDFSQNSGVLIFRDNTHLVWLVRPT